MFIKILKFLYKKETKEGMNCPIRIRNGKVYPKLKQYSKKSGSYYSKPHEVHAVLYKIFKETK